MHSIFSHNGAIAARDRLSPCSLPPLLPHIHLLFFLQFTLFCLFPLCHCLTHSLSPFVLYLVISFKSFPTSLSLPLPSSLFSHEALTTQSRFASYFCKPLKASHFRIFHRRATHQLCHSHERECTSWLTDTQHTLTHTNSTRVFWLHTCVFTLP